MTVTGAGSTWNTNGDLTLQGNQPILEVTNGALITSANAYLASGIDSGGQVAVDGLGSRWNNSGNVYLGDGYGTIDITGGGTVDIGGSFISQCNPCNNLPPTNLIDGVLRMHGGQMSNTAFVFAGGRLEGVGSIDVWDFQQNGGTLAPGNSAGTTTVQYGYTLNAGALEIEINGVGTAGANWDLLKVNGAVDLLGSNGLPDGTLNVILGFAPTIGSEFLVLEKLTSGSIGGTFANGSTVNATYNGLLYQFGISYTAGDGNDVELRTQAISIPGDYNFDGVVSAADYIMWRKRGGTQDEYNAWRANFGNEFSSNASATNTIGAVDNVPEPGTMLLLNMAVFGAWTVTKQRYRIRRS